MAFRRLFGIGAVAAGLVAFTCQGISAAAASSSASAPGITATTIRIGYLSSLTGAAASSFADGDKGAQAAIDAQNAQGGVNGRKLQLVTADDESSPTVDLTAAQKLVEVDGVFSVISFSAAQDLGVQYFQRQGVPVTGYMLDGNEWLDQPNSDLFTYGFTNANVQGQTAYSDLVIANELKEMGVTKLAGLAYGASSGSIDAVQAVVIAAKKIGIQTCYENLSVPFGGVDFTADVLAIQSAGCNGVIGTFVDASDIALSAALKQGGYTGKQLYETGYDDGVLSSPSSLSALDGDYITSAGYYSQSIPAVKTMFAAFKKYIPGYKVGIPDLGLAGSYISAELMIKGLEEAGTNPTRKSFIQSLRKVTNYNAGGLLATPVSFTGFGTPAMFPTKECSYLIQLKGTKYVVGKSNGVVCGARISFPSSKLSS